VSFASLPTAHAVGCILLPLRGSPERVGGQVEPREKSSVRHRRCESGLSDYLNARLGIGEDFADFCGSDSGGVERLG